MSTNVRTRIVGRITVEYIDGDYPRMHCPYCGSAECAGREVGDDGCYCCGLSGNLPCSCDSCRDCPSHGVFTDAFDRCLEAAR